MELDAINWQAGWRSLCAEHPDEFARRVDAATEGAAWVCDGNYGQVGPLIRARATHLIWLDYDRSVIMARVIRRSIARAFDSRPLWADNREDWRRWLHASHPIRWAWETWARRRTQLEAMLADEALGHLEVRRLRRPVEADALLRRVESGGAL